MNAARIPTGAPTALALTAAMALLAANSVAAAAWSPEMPQLHVVAGVASLTAVGLALVGWRWWRALPLGVGAGAIVIGLTAATMPSLNAYAWPFGRFEALGQRLGEWTADAVSGRVSTDTLPFGVAVAGALWLAVLLGGYAYRRWRQPWPLVGLLGAVLAVNVSYLDRSFDWHFAAFAVLAGLAIADAHRGRVLQRTGGRVLGGSLPGVSLAVVAVIGLGGVAGAHALPRLDREAGWDGAVSAVTGQFADLRGDVERLFGGVHPPTVPDELALGPGLPIVGVRGGDDRVIAQVRLSGAEGEVFLRVAAFDTYTGSAWELGDIETGDVVPPSAEAQSDPADVELRVLVRSATGVLLTLGEVQSISVPSRAVGAADNDIRVDLDGPLPATVPAELQTPLQTARALAVSGHWGGELGSWWPKRYALTLVQEAGSPAALLVSEAAPADVAVWRSASTLEPGDTYIVRATVPDATPDELRAAGGGYPPALARRYLDLPDGANQGDAFAAVLASIAAESPMFEESAFDIARAIAQWLCCSRLPDGRLRFPDETVSPAPPPATDAARWFLLGRRDALGRPVGGSAQLHATAMVALLRAAGVPSRLALGFRLTEGTDEGQVHTLWRHDVFTWAEAYLPGIGWVTFNPTPGPDVPLYDLSAAVGPGLGGATLEDLLRPFAPPPSPRPRAATAPSVRRSPAAAAGATTGSGWLGWLQWVGVALGGAAALAVATVGGWRTTLPGSTPAARTWASVHRWAWLTGAGARVSQTPAQFAAALEARTRCAAASMLAADYVQERFGGYPGGLDASTRVAAHHAVRAALVSCRTRGAIDYVHLRISCLYDMWGRLTSRLAETFS